MIARKRFSLVVALVAASLFLSAVSAGAQLAGQATQSGFSVENVLMELSMFLPEGAVSFGMNRFGGLGQGGQAGAQAGAQRQSSGQTGGQGAAGQGATGQAAAQGANTQAFAAMRNLLTFQRDPKLFLTAKQVDALVPMLKDLQQNPFPTPGKAKQAQATLDSALTKQQKDAWDKYVKQRDKAMEQLRQQFANRQGGTSGQGGTGQGSGAQGSTGRTGDAASGQGQANGQRVQRDPAEMRKEEIKAFLDDLAKYRVGLKG